MRCVIAVLALLVIVAAAKPAYHQFHHKVQLKPEALPAGANYNVTSTAVAGLSAGAFLAVQYHFAYSADLVGAGIIAGGPFYCAQGSLINAELQCMNAVEAISVPTLQAAASACADGKVCDDLGNLKTQNVYLFSGTFDSVVKQSVMKAAADFYSSYLTSSSQLNTTFSYPAQHSWPTDNYGNACYSLGSPYINNCGYDSSYAMLSHIFGALNAPTTAPSSNVKSLDQSKFTPDGASPSSISLGNNAYVYVPTGCQNGQACRLVIALHGCQQTIDDIGFTFVTNTGLNEVGEANNIIILYPQAIKAILMSNPNGCFDWWGYTGSNYANQKGPQMATIHNMANSLSGLF